MSVISIDGAKCAKDHICVDTCPLLLFEEDEQGAARPIRGAGDLCISCGHCLAVCPTGAVTLNGVSAEDCPSIERKLLPSEESFALLARSRRSIRAYKPEPVERETLERLLDLARHAPTASHRLPVHWTIFTRPEEVRELAGQVADWAREVERLTPVVRAFDAGFDVICRGAPHLVVAHAGPEAFMPWHDCVIALTTLELAAPTFGLGACWAGYFIHAARNSQAMKDRLALPEGHEAYGALLLGKPKYRYQRVPPRPDLKIEWR